ncbi:branched-chain amino acid ABC transporter ATP-binding protein/permease [Roseomonas marmotae]|uniref:ATP-binding cassette domain-containing protein n=1 Tax=Roseomonas marmotae TaxID=2768161 RepID=A0ABS3KIE1_9PROT|nr:branched-chain amino acid ABC transporter ATP-binding protein/permease [Roseomonas marmotae]MBO1077224.1 ATP-binding cassette domain-containing protein [Roseomonas marmotae]
MTPGPWRNPALWAALALAALSMLAVLAGIPLSRVTQIGIYMLYGAGVNLLIAYTGLTPFGASVFFGCGSYAAALAMQHVGGNEAVGLVAAILYSLVSSVLLGLVVLRRRGLYFSLLTLAASQIVFEIVFRWTALTGGENGLQNLPRPLFPNALSFHVFALASVVLCLWLLWRLVHAPLGRSFQGVRDNEARMASLGYDTYRLKLVAFVLTGVFVGFAGGLLALMLQGAYPNNLSWQHAGDALLMVVIGGVHHVLGPLWGAAVFILLEDWLSALLENWWLVFAPVLVIFALAAPEGLHGLLRRATGRHGWSLVRPGLPPRPATIRPYVAAGRAGLDPAVPLLTIRKLSRHFGSLHVAREIDLDIMPYRLHSLIGPNGAGKTTFFNMLTGILPPNAGEVRFLGTDITHMPVHRRARLGLGRSFQIVSIFPKLPAFENVRIAVQARSRHQNGFWRDAHAWQEINEESWSLLAAVGLEDHAGETCENLPHGARRLLEIAVTLATDAKLLLLDEPLAGLAEADRVVVSRLIRQLATSHAVLLVEHDLDRVVALSDRISVLHQGRLIADGPPAAVVGDPAVIAAYLGKSGEAPEALAAPPPAAPSVPVRGAGELLRVEGLVAGYGGSKVLDGIDLVVRPGEAVALLGRNGVGKTTLLRAITGTVAASGGRILLEGQAIGGQTTYAINHRGIALVPEGRRLFPNLTVRDNLLIAARPGGASLDEVYRLFPRLREREGVTAENLSGGERQMGAIARALMAPSKLLLLDEPFEGLAPAIVAELTQAILRLRGERAIILVEHHAEKVLPVVERVYVLVNGRVAHAGDSAGFAADHALQAKLLGVVEADPSLV